MMRVAIATLALLLLCSVPTVMASSMYQPEDDLRREAQTALDQILDLWRDGRFSELFDLSIGDRNTMESFSRRLSAAPLKPACCWQKLQDVSVKLQGDTKAIVRAKVGFEGRGGTQFKTRTIKLEKDDGVWRISRADILSMSESSNRKKGHRTYRK